MHEPWTQAVMLAAALVCSGLGFAWLALSMETHWTQAVGGTAPSPRGVRTLRVLGTLGIVASLVLCILADHPTIAVLVWVMSLAVGALGVAFTLTWKPRLLKGLSARWLAEPR